MCGLAEDVSEVRWSGGESAECWSAAALAKTFHFPRLQGRAVPRLSTADDFARTKEIARSYLGRRGFTVPNSTSVALRSSGVYASSVKPECELVIGMGVACLHDTHGPVSCVVVQSLNVM